jgi:hypothetical protein
MAIAGEFYPGLGGESRQESRWYLGYRSRWLAGPATASQKNVDRFEARLEGDLDASKSDNRNAIPVSSGL